MYNYRGERKKERKKGQNRKDEQQTKRKKVRKNGLIETTNEKKGEKIDGNEWAFLIPQNKDRILTIRFFNVIYSILDGESYLSAMMQSMYSTSPADWAKMV